MCVGKASNHVVNVQKKNKPKDLPHARRLIGVVDSTTFYALKYKRIL